MSDVPEGSVARMGADGQWHVLAPVDDPPRPFPDQWWEIANTVSGVTVEHDPQVGLTCSEPAALQEWLDDNGVGMPDDDDAFEVACRFMTDTAPTGSVNLTRGDVPDPPGYTPPVAALRPEDQAGPRVDTTAMVNDQQFEIPRG